MKTTNIILSVCIVLFSYSLGGQSLDGQVFIIENIATNAVLAVDGKANTGSKGSIVHLGQKNGEVNQQWQLVASGDGDNKYYIINQDSNIEKANYLEVSPLDVGRNGGKVHLWSYNGGSDSPYGANQVWLVSGYVDGSYTIASAHVKSNGAYVLEISKSENDKNWGKVQTGWNKGNENQKWNLIPVK